MQCIFLKLLLEQKILTEAKCQQIIANGTENHEVTSVWKIKLYALIKYVTTEVNFPKVSFYINPTNLLMFQQHVPKVKCAKTMPTLDVAQKEITKFTLIMVR